MLRDAKTRRQAGEEIDMAELDGLADKWPEWRFWTSREGRYACATRRRVLMMDKINQGLNQSIIEETIGDLRERLQVEAELEASLP